MLPYEHVKSIHDQKAAQFMAERDKAQLAAMVKAGQPGILERMAKAVGEALKSAGEVLTGRLSRPIRLA